MGMEEESELAPHNAEDGDKPSTLLNMLEEACSCPICLHPYFRRAAAKLHAPTAIGNINNKSSGSMGAAWKTLNENSVTGTLSTNYLNSEPVSALCLPCGHSMCMKWSVIFRTVSSSFSPPLPQHADTLLRCISHA